MPLNELNTWAEFATVCVHCDMFFRTGAMSLAKTRLGAAQTLKARVNHHKSEFKHMCPNNSLVHHYIQTGHTPNFAALSKFYSQQNFRSRLNLEANVLLLPTGPFQITSNLGMTSSSCTTFAYRLKGGRTPRDQPDTCSFYTPIRSTRLWCLLRSVAFLSAARLTVLFVFSV